MIRERTPRGAATVELALSLIVIVPIFLFALFLDDLLRYTLDLQEAVVSTPWDLTVQDYSVQPGAKYKDPNNPSKSKIKRSQSTVVQHQARLMFCDHESGKNTFQISDVSTEDDDNVIWGYPDCAETEHHVGLSSHVCWLAKGAGAYQVTCPAPDNSVGDLSNGLFRTYRKKYQAGGMVECKGREGVQNYILPKYFLPEFSKLPDKGRLTKEQFSDAKNGDNVGLSLGDGTVHGNALGGSRENTYPLQEEHFALLTDSWALNEPLDIAPGKKSGNLYDRVNTVYSKNLLYPVYAVAAGSFLLDVVQELVDPAALLGDSPLTPNVSVKPYAPASQSIKQEGGNKSYFSSPWQDWDQDPYQKTYNNRGNSYMGCQNSGNC